MSALYVEKVDIGEKGVCVCCNMHRGQKFFIHVSISLLFSGIYVHTYYRATDSCEWPGQVLDTGGAEREKSCATVQPQTSQHEGCVCVCVQLSLCILTFTISIMVLCVCVCVCVCVCRSKVRGNAVSCFKVGGVLKRDKS